MLRSLLEKSLGPTMHLILVQTMRVILVRCGTRRIRVNSARVHVRSVEFALTLTRPYKLRMIRELSYYDIAWLAL